MGLASLGGVGSFLGAASVELVADTRPLVAGLEKGKAETATASKSMSATASQSSAGITAAWSVAGAAVAAFAISSVKAAMTYQTALARLTAVAGANTDAFVKLAESQSRLTGFTETNIVQAEANLAVLGLTKDQMGALLPVVEDFARFTGQDIPTAASAMEKAFLGNTRALKQVGVEMTKAQFEALSFDQKVQLLDSHIKGSAAAFAGTYAGQVAKLGAEFENLKVEVGDRLMPVLEGATKVLSDDLDILSGHFDNLGISIRNSFGLLLNVIGFFVPAFKDSINAIMGFIPAAKDANTAATGLGGALDGTSASAASLAKSQAAATAAAKAQKTAEDSLKGGLLGLVAAQHTVAADQQNINDLRKKGKQGTVEFSDAELQLLQDQLSLTDAQKTYIGNLKDSKDTQQHVIAQITAMGIALGLTKDQINKLLGAYLNAYNQINKHPLYTATGGFSLGGKTAANTAQGGSSANQYVATSTTVHVHVAGNVTTQSDLVRAIQAALLQKQARNSGSTGLG